MTHATDIVAYTYRAKLYHARCIVAALIFDDELRIMNIDLTETILDNAAHVAGINRHDEYSFDSDEFPKVVFDSQLDIDSAHSTCGQCGDYMYVVDINDVNNGE